MYRTIYVREDGLTTEVEGKTVRELVEKIFPHQILLRRTRITGTVDSEPSDSNDPYRTWGTKYITQEDSATVSLDYNLVERARDAVIRYIEENSKKNGFPVAVPFELYREYYEEFDEKVKKEYNPKIRNIMRGEQYGTWLYWHYEPFPIEGFTVFETDITEEEVRKISREMPAYRIMGKDLPPRVWYMVYVTGLKPTVTRIILRWGTTEGLYGSESYLLDFVYEIPEIDFSYARSYYFSIPDTEANFIRALANLLNEGYELEVRDLERIREELVNAEVYFYKINDDWYMEVGSKSNEVYAMPPLEKVVELLDFSYIEKKGDIDTVFIEEAFQIYDKLLVIVKGDASVEYAESNSRERMYVGNVPLEKLLDLQKKYANLLLIRWETRSKLFRRARNLFERTSCWVEVVPRKTRIYVYDDKIVVDFFFKDRRYIEKCGKRKEILIRPWEKEAVYQILMGEFGRSYEFAFEIPKKNIKIIRKR